MRCSSARSRSRRASGRTVSHGARLSVLNTGRLSLEYVCMCGGKAGGIGSEAAAVRSAREDAQCGGEDKTGGVRATNVYI